MRMRRSLLVAATMRTSVLIGGAAADRRVFALLEHAKEPRLRLHRHVADLVEEERAALGLLEAAGRAGIGAGEGALLMTEQLGFDEVARNRGHVDGDEGALPPLAVIVQRPGDELLAGARFAGDHDRQIRLHQAGQHPVDFLHRGGAADKRHRLGFLVRAGCLACLGLGQRPADDGDEFLQVEGLRQIVVGAALRGPDGRHQRVLGAHHHDRQFRAQLLDPRQHVEGILVRHHDVGDHQIAFALADPAPQRCRIAGGANLVAGPRQSLVEHRPDGGVVVGDQNASRLHGAVPMGCDRRDTSGGGRGTSCAAAGSRIRRCRHGRRRSWPRAPGRGRCPSSWSLRRDRTYGGSDRPEPPVRCP